MWEFNAKLTKDAVLCVREAKLEDETILFEWVNDPITRNNAFSSQQITQNEHHVWFRNKLLQLEKCKFYIIETQDNAIAVGQVRFEEKGSYWEIDYALAPAFRGRGLGRCILELALAKLRFERPEIILVVAHVKLGNLASCKVLEALDFALSCQANSQSIQYQRIL